MSITSYQTGQFLLWHGSCHRHPIFDLNYVKENLVSLFETIAIAFAYLITLVIFLHLLVLNGFLGSENITWLLVEVGSRYLMFWASAEQFQNTTYISVTIIAMIGMIKLIRYVFNVLKAELHPKSNKLYKIYIKEGKLSAIRH